MSAPALSIVIPTYGRGALLARAVRSALGQTFDDLEVLVVDDASPEPAAPPSDDPRLRVLRLPRNRGHAAARNVGAREARGRWIAFLDDDDELLPRMAEASLHALATADLPPPVAVLSALQVIRPDGSVVETRVPPTLPRGAHFWLEEAAAERSFGSKQTLVLPRELLLEIGGFDEAFRSRVHSEFFLRLNPVCSILGLTEPTYRLLQHPGERLSRDPRLRQRSFGQLLRKHGALLEAHPRGFARLLTEHARTSWRLGQRRAALAAVLRALRVDPLHTVAGAARHARLGVGPRLRYGPRGRAGLERPAAH